MEYSVLAQGVGGKIRFDLQACPLVDILKKKKKKKPLFSNLLHTYIS